MSNIPYIVTDESITIVVKGRPYTISNSNAAYNEVRTRITNEDFAGIEQLFDTASAVGTFTKGNIVVKNNEVLYRGKSVHNHLVDRILEFMRKGLPYQPLVNFLEKVLQNPSARAVAELYTFLEHKNMPLTSSGNFLAYKGVQDNYYSVHSGRLTLLKGTADGENNTGHINNNVGEEVECPRNEVSDNTNDGCAQGLHIGSLTYALGWGPRTVIVEVNPADVVCVPLDCNCQKMRACHYKVIGLYEHPLTEPLILSKTAEVVEEPVAAVAEDVSESRDLGYDAGEQDAVANVVRDAKLAFSDENFDNSLNEEAFTEGYHKGYDESYVAPKNVVPMVFFDGVRTGAVRQISEATRQKLREAALRQTRDASGRYA